MRNDPFSRADRIAWGEEAPDCHPQIMAVVNRLMALHQPVDLPDQLIHGDITENVLFAPDLPPAIIDLSPFWRPAAYAQAIIVADALDWCGADQSTLPWVDNIPQRWQLIIRAEIFRISIHDGFFGGELGNHDTIDGHLATVALLECKLGHDAIR